MLTEKTKRKNEAPRTRRWIVMALIGLLIAIFAAGLILMTAFVPPDPTGRLHYAFDYDPTTPAEIAYDFDSGESESADLPFMPQSRFWNASPDGRWYFYWQKQRAEKTDLVIGDARSGEEWIVGQFYQGWTTWSADSRWLTLNSPAEAADGSRLSTRDLWRIQPDTRHVKRLTANDTEEHAPRLSPDGQSIAYLVMTQESSALYRIDIATETTQRLLEDENVTVESFAWAADSQWLAIKARPASPKWAAAQLWLFKHSTGDLYPISLEHELQTFQWSPQGHWLAYTTSGRDVNTQQIHLFNLDLGVGSARLITDNTQGDSYRWSPDGRWLAFLTRMPALPPVPYPYPTTTMGPDAINAYSRAQEEQERQRMATLSVWDTQTDTEQTIGADVLWTEMNWSPDSQWIAYLTHPSGAARQYHYETGTLNVANLVTGRVRPLLPSSVATDPTWAPDSQWLAFITYGQPLPEYWSPNIPGYVNIATSIWLIRPNGTDAQVFQSSDEHVFRSLSWQR